MGCTQSSSAAAVSSPNNVKAGVSAGTAKDVSVEHNHKNNHNQNKKNSTTTNGTDTTTPPIEEDESKEETTITASPLTPEVTGSMIGESPLTVGNLTVRYACISHRGRDPENVTKPNQDSYSVHESFLSSLKTPSSFFAVYDGHGPTGEQCSQFVQKRLPELLKKQINLSQFDNIQKQQQQQPTTTTTTTSDNNKNNDTATPPNNNNNLLLLSLDQLHLCLTKAHLECNLELRNNPNINDSYSGTTAISMYIQPDGRVTLSNVGDSRAVLGTMRNGLLQAVPLSKDQTPRRPDEAARCKAKGARILSFGQITPSAKQDDDIEDPPRVWAPNGHYPGTAFTRSLGDAIAEELGVTAEPELLTLKLASSEKVIVLASDGVWDVMENQQVVDICFAHKYNGDTPQSAAEAILKKSHQEWLLNEDCIGITEADAHSKASFDDMTIIVIFIDKVLDTITTNTTTTTTTNNNTITNSTTNLQNELPAPTPPATQTQHHEHRKRIRQKTLRNQEELDEHGNTKKTTAAAAAERFF